MQRVTIKDSEQTISFLTGEGIAERLVAGCSANPDTIGELLLATDIFWRGVAAAVMASLIIFDKTFQHDGPVQALDVATTTSTDEQIVCGAFQVVDEQSAAWLAARLN